MTRVTKKQNMWFGRSWIVLGLMLCGLGSLFVRSVWLQVVSSEHLVAEGRARHVLEVKMPAKRGMILDRRGEPLAISTPVDTVWANPKELVTAQASWTELAKKIGMSRQLLSEKVEAGSGREFIYLRRQLPPEHAAAVKALDVPGVGLIREYRRYYPLGSLTAHTVGLTNIDDRGQEGLELAFDNHLTGVDGRQRVLRDRHNRAIENIASVRRVEDGRDLTVTLDTRIQYLVEAWLANAVTEHQARGGTAVVIDVPTGDVLAMANVPTFNPNNRSSVNQDNLRNRAITDVFEPGSTMKPFAVAAALDAGLVTPSTVIKTGPGFVKVGKYTYKDFKNYGDLTVTDVIAESSNVGTIRVAHMLQTEQHVGIVRALGFGRATGVGFPGESAGVFNIGQRWGQVHRASLAIGYGMSTTALQLAQAYATIANGGVQMPARLVVGHQTAKPVRVMDERVARSITAMMERVTSDDGTARRARVPMYRVAGKTGTVKKASGGGYAGKRYQSIFAGFAPVTNPRLAMVVVVDEPGGEHYYGGIVAAPVFSSVMSSALMLLNVAPDNATAQSKDALIAQLGERKQ